MSDGEGKTTSSVSEGQASPPAGDVPKFVFGEWFTNVHASDLNPRKRGMYVRTIHRPHSRMNPGEWYELTDGKGDFWEVQPENLAAWAGGRVTDEVVERGAGAAWESMRSRSRAECGLDIGPFDGRDEEDRARWLDDTRAALEAGLSHAGGADGPEQADVVVLPEAVSLSGLEQTVEAMAEALLSMRQQGLYLTDPAERRRAARLLFAAALSTGQIIRASEPRNHAPWCRWEHEGSCPAENEPAPDHPVWAEVERLRAIERAARAAIEAGNAWPQMNALRAALSEGERHE